MMPLFVLRSGNARRDVVVGEIGHPVVVDKAIAGPKVYSRLPFLGAHLAPDGTEAGLVSHECKNIAGASMMKIAFAFLAACLVTTLAIAQPYPSKPVRLVIPFPPGGSNDVVGRVIAAQLTERLGQTMVVENSGAGGGVGGLNATPKCRPGGHPPFPPSGGLP